MAPSVIYIDEIEKVTCDLHTDLMGHDLLVSIAYCLC